MDMKILSLREQRQETIHNYLDWIDSLYNGLIFKPYWNQAYYPDGTLSNYHKVLVESMEEDVQKNANGNKAAGTRARKGLRSLKSAAAELVRLTLGKE